MNDAIRILVLSALSLSLVGCASIQIDPKSKKEFLHKTETTQQENRSCYTDRKTRQRSCYTYTIPVTTTVAEVSLSRSIQNNDCYLTLTGPINEELTKPAFLALEDIKSMQCNRKIVVLNSPGGSVSNAMALGGAIRDNKLITLFDGRKGADTRCASSCTLIFIGGIERIVTENPIPLFQGRMGFHQWSQQLDGKKMCTDEQSMKRRLSSYAERMLPNEGVQNFVEMTLQTECKSIERYSPAKLLETKIATGLKLD